MVINFEYGILGANYQYPQAILGTSVGKRLKSFYLQAGFSITGTKLGILSPVKTDVHHDISEGYFTRDSARYDVSVHPEFQLQYFF